MSILCEKIFSTIEPYFKIQLYGRDGAGIQKPRVRIELSPMPNEVRDAALAFTMPCVACGSAIHPFRERVGAGGRATSGTMYYAPSCPLDVKVGCSRGHAAKEEYKAVRLHFGK